MRFLKGKHLWGLFVRVLELNQKKDEPEAILDIDLADYLPPIDVSVKIYAIYDINVPHNSFECTFNLMLDWEDPSLALLALPDKETNSMTAGHTTVGTPTAVPDLYTR